MIVSDAWQVNGLKNYPFTTDLLIRQAGNNNQLALPSDKVTK
jgi:hypothetical protein